VFPGGKLEGLPDDGYIFDSYVVAHNLILAQRPIQRGVLRWTGGEGEVQ
jgi:hypothetical protein